MDLVPHNGDSVILDLWSRGQGAGSLRRSLLLLGAATPGIDAEARLDLPLDTRDAALLRLRSDLLGGRLEALATCPVCHDQLEFELEAESLIAGAEQSPADARAPTTRDLVAAAAAPDLATAAALLEARCGPRAAGRPEHHAPGEMRLAFDCPTCAATWSEALDVPAYLWSEIDHAARGLMDTIHALALRYGWSEAAVLALPAARRGIYLERCGV